MKRSEIIKLLSYELHENTNLCTIESSFIEDPESIANFIITKLEETGIVRPIKKVSNSETLVINQFGQVISKTEDSEVIEIGWEDEEK